MHMISWNYYNGALLLEGRPPHSNNSDVSRDDAKKALRDQGGYFCRWTTDFDCKEKTSWWYCIKDTPVELEKLTSKQRYRVNKGLKCWDVNKISSDKLFSYIDDLYNIAIDCFNEYPAKYRPTLDYSAFYDEHSKNIKHNDYWILTDKQSGRLHGYAICGNKTEYVSLYVVKVRPGVLKLEPNAAIGYVLCHYYLNEKKKRYICDGERNIRHETNYQEFLCRVLGFRFAYCHLNVVYNPLVHIVVILLRPMFRIFEWGGHFSKFFYNVYSLLKLDRILRNESI